MPKVPDFSDNTSGGGKPREPVRGDIKALYEYYRLSDHELTVIKLKDKQLKEEPVWFEGHMNFTFKDCKFFKEFYFGVEGAMVGERDRTPEQIPSWGSNVIRFEDCEFYKPFIIQQDCIVTFVRCKFFLSGFP